MPKIDYQRLVESIRSARLIQKEPREYRVNAIKRFQGKDSPINLIEQYTRIVTRGLVAKEPRCRISTFNPAHRPQVYTAAKWYNEEIQRQQMASVFQRCTFDAFIKMGIAKVSLASPADLAIRGHAAEIASPLLSYVSFDDFVWDARASDLSMATYVGHRFRLPVEVARNMKMFGPGRKNLQAATDGRYNTEGDLRSTALDMEPYYHDSEDWVELWEIYLPRHGVVCVLADEQIGGVSTGASGGSPLREQRYIGPPRGPYSYIRFNPIPDQALPNGTLTSLLLLDEAINETTRKLIRQAKRQKSNTLVSRANDVNNKAYKAANDGDIVPVDDPNAFQQVTRGGPDKNNEAFTMGLRDAFNRLAGNLETMGGTAPQAKTLGQEKILDSNASASMVEMLNEENRFAAEVCENFLWYEWYHPTKAMQTEYSVPGAPHISTTLTLSAAERHKVPFESLNLKVDPYSMPYRSPQETLQALVSAITQVFQPMAQAMLSAGVTVDFGRFAELFAELQDMPEMAEIIQTAGPQQAATDSGGQGGPQGTRTYERVSRSEATQGGQESSIRQALLGQDAGGANDQGGEP